jgi:hypothetical protein
MAKWPKSRGAHGAIAFAVAFLSAMWVFVQIEMGYFNRFYFAPHKAYPYPYHDAHSAQMALYRDCGFTLLGVSVVLFAVQRMFMVDRRE